jgi:hypothetical protein
VIKIQGLEQFVQGIEQWVLDCYQLAEGAYKGVVTEAFKHCVYGTPEWSGNLAYNWYISPGGPSAVYDKWLEYDNLQMGKDAPEPFSMARPNFEVIDATMRRAAAKIPQIKLGMPVFIENPTPYALAVQMGQGPNGREIRSANKGENNKVEMMFSAKEKGDRLGLISEYKAVQLARAANLVAGSL